MVFLHHCHREPGQDQFACLLPRPQRQKPSHHALVAVAARREERRLAVVVNMVEHAGRLGEQDVDNVDATVWGAKCRAMTPVSSTNDGSAPASSSNCTTSTKTSPHVQATMSGVRPVPSVALGSAPARIRARMPSSTLPERLATTCRIFVLPSEVP